MECQVMEQVNIFTLFQRHCMIIIDVLKAQSVVN
jgi:hypothetical protein